MKLTGNNSAQALFTASILPLRDTLKRVATSVVHNSDEAEDIVQDTMMKIWMKRDEWESIANIEAYCTTTCHRIAQDRMRAADNRLTSALDEESKQQPSHYPSPLQLLDAADVQRTMQIAISCLPKVQQRILDLRENEERTYDEIADELGISMSQVKVYLMRARQRLRKALTAEQ